MRRMVAAALAVGLGAAGLVGCDPRPAADERLPGGDPAGQPGPGLVDAAPYPVVLCHGFFGFEAFAGVDFIQYFFGVREALRAAGEVAVFTPVVDPFNDSATRGAQLLEAVQAVVAQTGRARVNLIGHSQGGLDARYVAHMRPDLVASVTTFATPHQGSPVADLILSVADRGAFPGLVDAFARLVGAPLYDAVGQETSVAAAARALSSAGTRAFNEAFPDRPGVAYYSIGGRSEYHPGGAACRVADAPRFVSRWHGALDPIDPLLFLTGEILDGNPFDPTPNDGLVPAPSSRWGRFLGCVPADHLDQVGHLLGDRPGLFNPFRHTTFFVEMVAWLRSQGH